MQTDVWMFNVEAVKYFVPTSPVVSRYLTLEGIRRLRYVRLSRDPSQTLR